MPKNKKDTVSRVREIVAPTAVEMGLSLWDVRFVKEGAVWYLRIYIDKDGGISVDDCADFSRAVNGLIDQADPIDKSYILEVSSPGLERELTREEHFVSCLNKNVFLKTIRPDDNGVRDFAGTLVKYENAAITIKLREGGELVLPVKEASYIKLDDFNMSDFES